MRHREVDAGRSGAAVAGYSSPLGRRRRGRIQVQVAGRVDRHRHQPADQHPHPAIHQMCQNPATTPTKARFCASTLAQTTIRDLPDRVARNWWRRDGHALVLDNLVEDLDE
jgi:hypothetical protein